MVTSYVPYCRKLSREESLEFVSYFRGKMELKVAN